MQQSQIDRINYLARKKKAEGLTEAELDEQRLLRLEYIRTIRANLRGQLDNIDILNPDGSVENLGEKYDKYDKEGN